MGESNENDCLVSVIVPAYNAGRFIEKAVRSVLDQTMTSFEVIIVNDASRDDTKEKSLKLCEADKRVSYYENERNLGVSATRNVGIKHSKGKYIAIIDSDDGWKKERLDIMVKHMERDGLDMLGDQLVVANLDTGRESHAFRSEWMDYGKDIDILRYFSTDWPGLQGTLSLSYMKPLFRKEFMERQSISYDKDITLGEDSLIYSCIIMSGAKFRVIPDALYMYSVRDDSLSQVDIPTRQLLPATKKLLDFYVSRNDRPDSRIIDLIEKKYQSYLLKHVIDSARFGDPKASFSNFYKVKPATYLNWGIYIFKNVVAKMRKRFGLASRSVTRIDPPFLPEVSWS
ncbi:glycosyltransferase family 2 protein [Acetobacter sp.]|uniref:glycosyltransferase family 2 protein n=1 Tax=Acetobacter sp. TaxID=440 RepID=UPI0039EB517E